MTVFEAKVFHRDNDDMHCSGRIMVDCASSPVVGNNSFWPQPIYTRPWKFPEENKPHLESSAATGANIPEHAVLAQPVGQSGGEISQVQLTEEVQAVIEHYPAAVTTAGSE